MSDFNTEELADLHEAVNSEVRQCWKLSQEVNNISSDKLKEIVAALENRAKRFERLGQKIQKILVPD